MDWFVQRIDHPEECYRLEAGGEVLLGRIPTCTITLSHNTVSRLHCKFSVTADRKTVTVEDLHSGNGVYVRGERIAPAVAYHLFEGETMGIGLPVDCDYPDMEASDHYRFKLIKKALVSNGAVEIIDLTLEEDVRIKKELVLDLERPIEILDDDDESFDIYRTAEPEPKKKSAVPQRKITKKTRKSVPKEAILLPDVPPIKNPSVQRKKTRTSDPPATKTKQKSLPSNKNVERRVSEPPKLITANTAASESSRSTRAEKLKEVALKKNDSIRESRSQNIVVNKPRDTVVKAKVTTRTRASLLLENMLDSTKRVEKEKPKSSSNFSNAVDFEDNLVLSRLLGWNPLWLESEDTNVREPPIYAESTKLERMRNSFADYENYKRIIGNFLMFEIWNQLCINKSKIGKNVKQYHILKPLDSSNQTNIVIGIRIGPHTLDKSPPTSLKHGDVLILKYKIGDLEHSNFAIVNNSLSQMKSRSVVILDLFVYSNNALLEITRKTIVHLNFVCNISYEMAALYSLYRLDGAPLRGVVVSPKSNHFAKFTHSASAASERFLDHCQLNALSQCLGAILTGEPTIQLVQGPPGTGKTTFLAVLALEYFLTNGSDGGKKILLCSNSNVGADNLCNTLTRIKENSYEDKRCIIKRIGRGDGKNIKEQSTEESSIMNSDIIVTTLLWCTKLKILKYKVSTCLIDDASLASEVEILCPMWLNLTSVVLTGDVQQLSSSFISKHSESMGFAKSFFSRICEVAFACKRALPALLRTEHRMPPRIFQWLNRRLYNNKVTCAPLPRRPISDIPSYRVLLMPKAHSCRTMIEEHSTALCVGRLAWACRALLVARNIRTATIAILVQNLAQREAVEKIVASLDAQKTSTMRVSTHEGFQGDESDVVIVAPLKSPTSGEVNAYFSIGLSRAKWCQMICLDEANVDLNPRFHSLLDDAKCRRMVATIPDSFFIVPDMNAILEDQQFLHKLREM